MLLKTIDPLDVGAVASTGTVNCIVQVVHPATVIPSISNTNDQALISNIQFVELHVALY